jgi:uncharacterized protein YjbI with pentapeptide repeats
LGLEPPKPEASAPAAAAPGVSAPVETGVDPLWKKVGDLDALKSEVESAATVAGTLWLSYIVIMLNIALAANSVSPADLFLEKPVRLPFLGTETPLDDFFVLAPILFLIVHAYTLVHLVFLTEKARRFDEALHDPARNVDAATREALQWQLQSNIFIQFLAGPRDLRGGSFGWLLRAIGWVTLVIAPVLLLLLMQIQFLPFHSSFITWTHRMALFVDLALVWWLWRKILSGREADAPRRPSLVLTLSGVALTGCAALFSCAIATFPGEWQAGGRPGWTVATHNALFNAPPDYITRRRFPFSNTLVLTGFSIYEGLSIDDPEKAKWRNYLFRARGRDLTGAIFDFADLPRVDFTGAELDGASLRNAQLQGASLDGAQLQGASLRNAQLQGASLHGAQLRGASLEFAQLQGAWLDGAQLQGASLDGAQLQGASLDSTQLEGTSLDSTQLQGASLHDAHVQGASLVEAQLQGASLEKTALQATDLSDAFLWRTLGEPASISSARLSATDDAWRPVWRDGEDKVHPWDDKAYGDLRKSIEALPPGETRDQALDHIRALDCADQTLASCDPASPPAPAAWSKGAQADDAHYPTALVAELRRLVCSGDDEATYVLRGISHGFPSNRLQAAGPAGHDLIDDLMDKDSKECPVAAALTDADRAHLLQIKQAIEAVPKPVPDGPAYSP